MSKHSPKDYPISSEPLISSAYESVSAIDAENILGNIPIIINAGIKETISEMEKSEQGRHRIAFEAENADNSLTESVKKLSAALVYNVLSTYEAETTKRYVTGLDGATRSLVDDTERCITAVIARVCADYIPNADAKIKDLIGEPIKSAQPPVNPFIRASISKACDKTICEIADNIATKTIAAIDRDEFRDALVANLSEEIARRTEEITTEIPNRLEELAKSHTAKVLGDVYQEPTHTETRAFKAVYTSERIAQKEKTLREGYERFMQEKERYEDDLKSGKVSRPVLEDKHKQLTEAQKELLTQAKELAFATLNHPSDIADSAFDIIHKVDNTKIPAPKGNLSSHREENLITDEEITNDER